MHNNRINLNEEAETQLLRDQQDVFHPVLNQSYEDFVDRLNDKWRKADL